MATWATTKKQAAEKLGLLLADKDVLDIPMLVADAYGNFVPGPNGLPQYMTTGEPVEGNLANPVPVPANALHFDTPFLTDIAHSAAPHRGRAGRRHTSRASSWTRPCRRARTTTSCSTRTSSPVTVVSTRTSA